MEENKIERKKICEILGMKFFIPNYQRGYRWTKQQVKDLLDDVNEFDPNNGGFYCLQPLVVKKHERDILSKIKTEAQSLAEVEQLLKGEWEVIDGQQRLTTIFIILSCLSKSGDGLYCLEYETRKGSADFLTNIDKSQSCKNIDFYHICEAKEEVEEWLELKAFSDEKKVESFKQKLLSQVEFIWYESVDEDPILVFTRLNMGKISLTNAELIKALFLNSSRFKGKDNRYVQLRQREIASEWDDIEYALQDDEFWLFLHEKNYERPTRIDFIFDLICDQNILKLDEEQLEFIGTDGYKTFRYFYEYFKLKNSNITSCWKEVKTCYQVFREWYDDLELYHYIGYLIACQQLGLPELIQEWKKGVQDKKQFLSYLKNEIKGKLFSSDLLDRQYKEDGSDKTRCRSILLFHNIQTVINQNNAQRDNNKYHIGTFYKFPFHLYKLESWDVEHINSNTENQEDDDNTQKEWLLNVYLSADNDVQKMIKSYFEIDGGKQKELFATIKEKLPELEKERWSQEEKNRIWNYTLLDSSTNRSYGNAIFSGKRRIIIGKDKGELIAVPKLTKDGKMVFSEASNADSSFVPPCTKQVFLKYYSPTATHSNYWTKLDAEAYLEDIKKCLSKLEEKGYEQE